MCGVVSCFSPHPVEARRFQAALDSLERRGPDGEGSWFDGNGQVGLGQRRLEIVGGSEGRQPVFNEDRSLVAVVNGEFYGHRLQRMQLEARGHRLGSHSDSELVCHLYEEHGLDFVEHLRGEFAVILYDVRHRRLVAVRDRFGVKPLCYARIGEELWLASRARALFAAGLTPRWDDAAFYHAACTQYLAPGDSWFAGVQQLPPGCLLLVEEGRCEVRRYWDYPRGGEPPADPLEEFGHLLDEAVRYRLPGEHRAAFQLSGGLDSGAVVALATQALDRVDAFTVSFDQQSHDEAEQAAEMASHCGAELHLLRLSAQQLLDALPQAVAASEGVAVNAHLSAKYLLAQRVREAGFKVVLTGEGADEVLLGYPHYRLDLSLEAEPILASNTASAGIMLTRAPGLNLSAVQARLGHVPHFLRAKAALGKRLLSVMQDDFLQQNRTRDCYAEMLEGADLDDRPPVEQSAYLWNRSALANYILHTLGDGCEMAHSLEGRLPFLDHRLAEFLARVPLDWKIRGGTEKYILREAVRPLIPHALYERQKHPFMAPALDLRESCRDLEHAFVDPAKLNRRLDSLARESPQERLEWQAALMWLRTSAWLQESFRLGVK